MLKRCLLNAFCLCMFIPQPVGAHSTPSLLWLLLSLGCGNHFKGKAETKQHCPQQLSDHADAQQKQALEVNVPDRPGGTSSHCAGSSRENILYSHCASFRYPETQPQWDAGPRKRLLAGGGAAISTHLQRPLPPHYKPYYQPTAALPAAGLVLRPGGLGRNWQSEPSGR